MTNPGPIEYVGQQPPKKPKYPKTPKNSKTPQTPRSPKKPSRFAVLGGIAGILGFMAALAAYAMLGRVVPSTIAAYACDATACSTEGMVVAGWLVIALPAVLIGATAATAKHVDRTTRRILITLSVLAGLVALMFIPGRHRDMSDVVQGPGADQFIDGMGWALGALGASVAVALLLAMIGRKAPAVERHYSVVLGVAAAVLLLAAAPVAIAKTGPGSMSAEDVFPAVLEMNDDILTRTAVGDQRGCTGVLADESLLNRENCVLTLHAAYRTDDSDAVASLWAVLYLDDDTADSVRDGLPKVTSDTALTVFSTSRSWVLVGISEHADGATITSTDRPWVMWPLRQVAYRFIGYQGGLLIDPDPGDDIHPRTAA
ncbi:hypothetical protein HDA40_001492 [Hamadaea flava]|uniref:Uncharacterized protein n=1 Tax=Hamadaea flava TaxID=1742688 RepID=A0ABV8LQ95_9ACTN|nr:hypothetical protein [Hamadaea flava]MCP2322985.1 hypothetical protein [Hamadaea flava]